MILLVWGGASFWHHRSETDSESGLSFCVLLEILSCTSSVCALSVYLAIYLPGCQSFSVLIVASNMLICLSPCLTEFGSLPESVGIKGWGKWLCFLMHTALWGWAMGDALGCRGQRLCGSGLLALRGGLERTPSSVYCTRLHDAGETHTQMHAYTLSEHQHWAFGEFSWYTYAWGRERERAYRKWHVGRNQSSIASSWSAKSSNMLPMSSKIEADVFLLERELEVGQQNRKSSDSNKLIIATITIGTVKFCRSWL